MRYFHKLVYLVASTAVSVAVAGSYEGFFQATENDDARTVQQLLQRGFDANSRNPDGQTALFLAMRNGAFGVAEALLADATLDVNALNPAGESALMMAALKGHVAWMQRLIDRGAQIDKKGWSPLHYAASGLEPEAVKLLLERGATINARSPNGTTPIMLAARYGAEASVDLLLVRGADPKARNDLGLTPADFARDGARDRLSARLAALTR